MGDVPKRSIRIVRVDATREHVRLQLEALEGECFEQAPRNLFSRGIWWIAYDGTTPVGYCGIRQSSQWDNVGYMNRAGVTEHARGMGLQKRLIKVRVAYAKRQGWICVITDTTKNPASANSLIGCGFRMYEPQRPWSYRDACYWRKYLK